MVVDINFNVFFLVKGIKKKNFKMCSSLTEYVLHYVLFVMNVSVIIKLRIMVKGDLQENRVSFVRDISIYISNFVPRWQPFNFDIQGSGTEAIPVSILNPQLEKLFCVFLEFMFQFVKIISKNSSVLEYE